MKKYSIIIGVVIISLVTLILYKMNYNKDVNIGLVAGLSGKYSSLGVSVRNGVTLALDEVDYKAGDYSINLIQKDDKQDANEARDIIKEFLNNNINIIIGNATSSMTKESIPLINIKKDALLFSPTASSDEFSNIDDNFIRAQVAFDSKSFNEITKYFLQRDKKRVYVVYDKNNQSYSDTFMKRLEKSFLDNGGEKYIGVSTYGDDYKKILNSIPKDNLDLIVIIASSIDSAKLIQYLKLNGVQKDIFCSAWAKTSDFIANGGRAVENVYFTTGYDDYSDDKRYQEFVKKYEEKFKVRPSAFAVQAYETAKIIVDVMKQDGIENLKENILKHKTYKGLQGSITFDKYGDVYRDYFIMQVKNAKYVKLQI